ncbi:hypothetical protein RLO149_c036570 [Roseobacter litoralis Och 149]|uniref:Uncharacterized protein n=1 Tax=Roseobacter litoralis (strain ATCC 49566 / DSM 6996 / JCM 21268 / NBRC 15278 / OCh 149) TaxID=391595 RepID=F7ZBJ9_ROSLO|nr:hypothetical protein RLO149_c036570 [Roseobacter litoralis Och 149]
MSGWSRLRIRSSSSPVILAPENERSTTVAKASRVRLCTMYNTGTSGHLRGHHRRSRATNADWRDPAPEWACVCPMPVCGIACPARDASLRVEPEQFLVPAHRCKQRLPGESSLQSPLWPIECPNGDIRTDGVRLSTHAADYSIHHHPDAAYHTGRQACQLTRPKFEVVPLIRTDLQLS